VHPSVFLFDSPPKAGVATEGENRPVPTGIDNNAGLAKIQQAYRCGLSTKAGERDRTFGRLSVFEWGFLLCSGHSKTVITVIGSIMVDVAAELGVWL